MRRFALVLALLLMVVSFAGCRWNTADPLHPRVCPQGLDGDDCRPCYVQKESGTDWSCCP